MSELELSLFRQRSQGALKSKARRGALFLGVAAGCVTTGGDRIEQLINALRGMASAACRGQPAGRWLLSDGALTGQARDAMAVEMLDVVADRGYYEGGEIRACEEAGITVTLPKPMTSGAKAAGRFGKQDFAYVAADDIYRCPAGERLTYRFQCEEDGKTIRRYSTSACKTCALKAQCTTGPERRISRWEHEAVLEKVQDRLDHNPNAMGVRRQTAEHPFGTIKCWMGATHFLTKRLPKVATEMALNVLAYNLKRVLAILGVSELLEAMLA